MSVPGAMEAEEPLAALDKRGGVEKWETEPWYDEIIDRWTRATERLA